jgi:hypothetical protein
VISLVDEPPPCFSKLVCRAPYEEAVSSVLGLSPELGKVFFVSSRVFLRVGGTLSGPCPPVELWGGALGACAFTLDPGFDPGQPIVYGDNGYLSASKSRRWGDLVY